MANDETKKSEGSTDGLVLSASEALYGFAGWLTSQPDPTIFGSGHNCAPIADRIQEFCDANHLPEPRAHWSVLLKHPT